MSNTIRINTVQQETVYNLAAAGHLSLRDHVTNTTTHLIQKEVPLSITHLGKVYYYHGTCDGVAFYSTQAPEERH